MYWLVTIGIANRGPPTGWREGFGISWNFLWQSCRKNTETQYKREIMLRCWRGIHDVFQLVKVGMVS